MNEAAKTALVTGDEETGHFDATAHPKKLTGPIGIQTWPEYFNDTRGQEASFDAMVKLTEVGFPDTVDNRATQLYETSGD